MGILRSMQRTVPPVYHSLRHLDAGAPVDEPQRSLLVRSGLLPGVISDDRNQVKR